mmetsp:Transcript_118772/g.322254  ORF Transcript_118772/g.322254 Transcript_118772/m.322254 type:complete len:294 (+) Transcript_118772:132-1013(+)
MVCAFGLGPEATSWLGAAGASVVGGGGAKRGFDFASWAAQPAPRPSGGRRANGDFSSFSDKGDEKKDEKAGDGDGKEGGGAGCFPGRASVYVKGRGPVPVSGLCQGDLLLCGDAGSGHLLFSPFVGHMHKEVSTPASFVSVKAGAAEGSPLLLSREHLVFAASSADAPLAALPAAALAQGQWILRVDPLCGSFRRVQVSEVAEVSDKGWYAPLTQCGTVVVEGALCSCYADALPATLPGWFRRFATTHQAMHQAVLPLRLAALFAAAPQKGAEALEGIHPYCRALMALPMAIA